MRRIAVALVASAALIFSGCFYVRSIDLTQGGPGALVALVAETCWPGTAPNCAATWPATDFATQLAVAYNVPNNLDPQGVTGTGPHNVTFTRNDSYAAVLEATPGLASAPGRHWISFVTGDLPAPTDPTQHGTITALFELPSAGGGPLNDSLATKTRMQLRTLPGPTCTITDPWSDPECFKFDPTFQDITDFAAPVRDVALRADGGTPTGDAGTTIDVPFTFRYAGLTPSGDIPYTGSTTIPGGTVASGNMSRDTTGETVVPAKLSVPSGTAAGNYLVTVVLDLAGAATRELTRTVTVVQPPAPAPPPTTTTGTTGTPGAPGTSSTTIIQQSTGAPTVLASLASIRAGLRDVDFVSTRRSSVLANGVQFTQEFVTPGRATWDLKKVEGTGASAAQSVTYGRLARSISSAGQRSLRIRLNNAGKRAVRARRARVLRLTTVFTDGAGRRTSVVRNVRLR